MINGAAEFFDSYAADYIQQADWAADPSVIDVSQRMLNKLPGDVIIDLGTGNGLLLSSLARSEAALRIGLDLSMSMLRLVRDPQVNLINGDAHRLPVRDHCVDLVLCRQVLQYCDIHRVLVETHRVLKPGGSLHIVQLTDYEGTDGHWLDQWTALRGIPNRQRLRRSQLIEHVEKCGMTVAELMVLPYALNHTWLSFFQKNHVPKEQREEVKSAFRSAPPSVVDKYHLSADEIGPSYVREFTYLTVTKVPTRPSQELSTRRQ